MTDHVFLLRRLSENYTELPEIGPKKSSFGTKLMSSIDKLGILNSTFSWSNINSHARVDIKHAEKRGSFAGSCLDRTSCVASQTYKMELYLLQQFIVSNWLETFCKGIIFHEITPPLPRQWLRSDQNWLASWYATPGFLYLCLSKW